MSGGRDKRPALLPVIHHPLLGLPCPIETARLPEGGAEDPCASHFQYRLMANAKVLPQESRANKSRIFKNEVEVFTERLTKTKLKLPALMREAAS